MDMIGTIRTGLKTIIVGAIAAVLLAVGAAPMNIVGAAGLSDIACDGLAEATTDGGGCADGAAAGEINTTVETAINLISVAVAVISVIMIIVAGIKYVTSQGDPAGTNSAKNTIIYALVGLGVVLVAQTLVKFVVGKLST